MLFYRNNASPSEQESTPKNKLDKNSKKTKFWAMKHSFPKSETYTSSRTLSIPRRVERYDVTSPRMGLEQ
jgi:hypothetical protein